MRTHLVQKRRDPAPFPAATAMHVCSEKIVLLVAVMYAIDAMATFDLICIDGVGREIFQAGIVKFMCGDRGGFLPAIAAGGLQPRVASPHGTIMHHRVTWHHPHHLATLSLPIKPSRQIHQPPAFSIGGQPSFDGASNTAAQG